MAGLDLSMPLTLAARRLAAVPDAERAQVDDPRFSALIEAIDPEARTAADLAERLLSRTRDPLKLAGAVAQIQRLVERIDGLSRLTVEQELLDIFAATPYKRNREILIAYYGWQDGRQHTLTEIGAKFGITARRVRQVCAKLVRKCSASLNLTPAMDRVGVDRRADAMLRTRNRDCAGRAASHVGRVIGHGDHDRGRPIGPARLCKTIHVDSADAGRAKESEGRHCPEGDGNRDGAARRLRRSRRWRITLLIALRRDDRLVIRPDQLDTVSAIVDLAKKEVYFHGLATVEQIAGALSDRLKGAVAEAALIKATLLRMEGFCWLDEASGWFRLLPICRHGLPKAIDKTLAVAGAVTVAQLRRRWPAIVVCGKSRRRKTCCWRSAARCPRCASRGIVSFPTGRAIGGKP